MIQFSVQLRDRIFVKGYGLLAFAKYMGKSVGKNLNNNLSGTYSQNLFDHDKQSATDALKTSSKRVIKKQQNQQVINW